MNLHTTGPWSWRKTLGPMTAPNLLGPCVIEDKKGNQIAVLRGFRNDQQCADAAIMAAAPELLTMLKRIIEDYPDIDNSILDEARNIIKKALVDS